MEWKRSSLLSIAIGAMVCQSALAQTVNARFPREPSEQENVFTRMFPDLPPFAAQSSEMRNAASNLGRKDGLLDAKDILTDPIQSILDPAKFSPNNPDNEKMTAGMTFLGQFLDHDITLDLRSSAASSEPTRAAPSTSAPRPSTSTRSMAKARSDRPSSTTRDSRPPTSGSRWTPIPGSERVSRKARHALRPAARDGRRGDRRRQPQRRERRHLAVPCGDAALPQCCHRPPAEAQPAEPGPDVAAAVRPRPAHRDLALPVVHPARVPAEDDRPGAPRSHPAIRQPVLRRRQRAPHAQQAGR